LLCDDGYPEFSAVRYGGRARTQPICSAGVGPGVKRGTRAVPPSAR
jgi:hypothetical protein